MAPASMLIAMAMAWSPSAGSNQEVETDAFFWVGNHVTVSIHTKASSAKPKESKGRMYVAGKRAYGLETGPPDEYRGRLRQISSFVVDVFSLDGTYRKRYQLPASLWADCFQPRLHYSEGHSMETLRTITGLKSWANADASQVFLLLSGSDGAGGYEMYYSLDLKSLKVKRQAVIDNGIVETLWVRLPTPQKIANRQE